MEPTTPLRTGWLHAVLTDLMLADFEAARLPDALEESMTRLLGTVALISMFLGCAGESGGVDCDTMVFASVELTVTDAEGTSIDHATAEYTVSGQEWLEPAECEAFEDKLICGWEIVDTFQIWVDAEGYTSDFFEVTVESDECHVITEYVDVQLAEA